MLGSAISISGTPLAVLFVAFRVALTSGNVSPACCGMPSAVWSRVFVKLTFRGRS